MYMNGSFWRWAAAGLLAALGATASGALADRVPSTTPAEHHRPHAGMLRFPDVSATHIVFVYANDLWLVPREGGLATPIASPPGPELLPKFSPDGSKIAFVGNYEGNRDLYVVSTDGGVATRVTYHPAVETLCDWTPDGRLIYSTNGFAGLPRQTQLYTVSPDGGLPTKLPVPYGANGTISHDGRTLAYTPHSIDFRTWKRYRGGMQTDIWLFDLQARTSKQITDWEGLDSLPMWHGDIVYYLSDASANHRLNIWSYDTKSGERKQVTDFAEYDVKWPSIGPGQLGKGEIVFQNGSNLFLLDLASGKSRAVDVVIPGDRPKLRPHMVDANEFIASWDISPTGKRALFEARGDIWTVPAKEGVARNLTRTSGTAERDPAWSPDGQWIAYLSDATGEYELYIVQSDGKEKPRQLTKDGKAFRFGPSWSPDSKQILFTDKSGAIYRHVVASGETKLVDTNPSGDPTRASWAPDSRWIVYTKQMPNRLNAIWLYEVEKDKKHQATSGRFNDSWPAFDRDGDFLYFSSARSFSAPIYEDLGTSFVYTELDQLFSIPLRKDVKSPLAPKSDEELWGEAREKAEKEDKEEKEKKGDEGEEKAGDKKKDDEKKTEDKKETTKPDEATTKPATSKPADDKKNGKDKKPKEIKPIKIDLDGFERRAVLLPPKKGIFSRLAVNDKGQLLYVRDVTRGSDGKPSIQILDLKDKKAEKKEEKTVLAEVGDFTMSADGKKILARKDEKKMAIVDAAADQKMDKPLLLAGMTAHIDPRAEWKQIFTDAWRIHRDYFYVSNMHGINWDKTRAMYERMLADCVCRDDVTYVIGEMISELNIGHAYVRGLGDVDKEPTVSVGMLGCDFELFDGAYRIKRIFEGGPWDADGRGPLSEPGVDVKEGEYLLAVNQVPVDTAKDPWAALQGLADKPVTITISAKPARDDKARDIVVKPIASEATLRYRSWIERNRAYVERQSEGKLGYIYVPNTGLEGQNDLVRQFFGQIDKAGLIIDERWNGGGQIPTRFIELLNRPVTNYWARRDGEDWTWPPDSHQGPKCMLINGLAGSGGDMFPWLFKFNKIGKVIGMRTWGGLVGISGNPPFIDGGNTNVPTFGFYEKNGTWGVEGHGVDPDIVVVDDPAKMVDGGDPQLDAAIAHLNGEVKAHPYVRPKRPEAPDRRGMGIREEDK
jgi:tricorn protease